MKYEDLRKRTKEYALQIIRLYTSLPNRSEHQILGKQLLRSGTSVGTQYREGFRAKSNADYINKLQGALQELEESMYWLELLHDITLPLQDVITALMNESNELIAILTTLVKNKRALP